jgi:hypothetical protein
MLNQKTYYQIYREEALQIYNEMLEELPTIRRKKNLLLKCKKELLERKEDLRDNKFGYLHGEKITPRMHRENDIDIDIVADLLAKLEESKQVANI